MNKVNTLYINEYKIASDVSKIPDIRTVFIDFLLSLGIDSKHKEDWKLVFSEAINNAIEHGNKSDKNKLVIAKWWSSGKTIWLEVQDEGNGPSEEKLANPSLPEDPLAEGGRGLFIIHNFADHFQHWKSKNGYVSRIGKTYQRLNDIIPQNPEMNAILDELSDCYESLSLYDRMSEKLIGTEEIDHFIDYSLEVFMDSREYDAINIEIRQNQTEADFSKIANLAAHLSFGSLNPDAWKILEENESLTWQTGRNVCPFKSGANYTSGACVPVRSGGGVVALIAVAYTAKTNQILSNDLNNLRVLADIIGISLSQNLVKKERDIRKRLATEMDIATKLQQRLLPVEKQPPIISGYDLFFDSISATEIAGDFVEVRQYNENEYLGCVIDVMGKGVSAAILAGIFRSQFIAFNNRHDSLSNFLESTNKAIETQLGDATMFITVFVFKLNTLNNTFTYVNAGHPPALLLKPKGDTVQLLSSAPPIGLFRDIEFEEITITLNLGERILVVTDGLYEWTVGSDIFGIENMIDWFEKRKSIKSQELWTQFRQIMNRSRENAQIEQEDDETILILNKK